MKRYFKRFNAYGKQRSFMFYRKASTKNGLKESIPDIKAEGRLYRITRSEHGFILWIL